MALVIEDGTSLPHADSYASVAQCVTYAAGHGLTFAGEEPEREARLRRATQYLDAQYAYKGEEETDTQGLAWPRTVAPGVVPKEIVAACCELACKTCDLWTDVDSSAVIEDTIGPMTTKFAAPANGGQVRFAAVDAMVKRWLAGGGSTIRVVRA